MTTIPDLKAFWDALPNSNRFESHFSFRLDRIEENEREIEKLQARLRSARKYQRELARGLHGSVTREAQGNWTPAEIADAVVAAENRHHAAS